MIKKGKENGLGKSIGDSITGCSGCIYICDVFRNVFSNIRRVLII
jgi:hypothetical protein